MSSLGCALQALRLVRSYGLIAPLWDEPDLREMVSDLSLILVTGLFSVTVSRCHPPMTEANTDE
ncbi:MAG: hypothetical protein C3F08_03455 [Candidatus Methylomirabilota bacterium]|nr:MAG: hypothetical protein C3F08_03455 [candidate division NC10 bacterium]